MGERFVASWTRNSIAFILILAVAGCSGNRRQPTLRANIPPKPPAAQQPANTALERELVRVQVVGGAPSFTVTTTRPLTVHQPDGMRKFSPNTWTFTVDRAVPAQERFHLFIKSFHPYEAQEAEAFAESWRRRGHAAHVVTFGKRFETASERTADLRTLWVSLGRFGSVAEAERLQKQLHNERIWGWIRREVVTPGRGTALLGRINEAPLARLSLPLRMEAVGPITVHAVDDGLWEARIRDHRYGGELEIGVNVEGQLELTEVVSSEDYLAGVLPAEMPIGWPIEALKAQALAARSEVFANMAKKHKLEGFDFCNREHCRAYVGRDSVAPVVTQALEETRGEVITKDGQIITAVFSSNCGGWTENNDTVWSGPPDAALRGTTDLRNVGSGDPRSIERWVSTRPAANCSGDDRYFRWRRSYTKAELSALINKYYGVGSVNNIELGERGPSGRLKWVRVTGSKGAATIQKDLPIRQAFGGIPSAMFIIERGAGSASSPDFTLIGGGRGHGVGMCQHGARGMALQGMKHSQIVAHYYNGTRVERFL